GGWGGGGGCGGRGGGGGGGVTVASSRIGFLARARPGWGGRKKDAPPPQPRWACPFSVLPRFGGPISRCDHRRNGRQSWEPLIAAMRHLPIVHWCRPSATLCTSSRIPYRYCRAE